MPAELTVKSSATPHDFSLSCNSAAAIGLRQVLPVQTNNIRTIVLFLSGRPGRFVKTIHQRPANPLFRHSLGKNNIHRMRVKPAKRLIQPGRRRCRIGPRSVNRDLDACR